MSCDCSRRQFLKAGLGSFAGLALHHNFGSLFAQDAAERAKARSTIVLWMDGGPTHLDTFDPKPGRKTGGEFKAIKTAAGIEICEHLPKLAQQGRHFSIVRSVHTGEDDHLRGRYLLHTGYKLGGQIEHPSIGSIVSYERSENTNTPNYVTIKSDGNLIFYDDAGPAFLGHDHAPFLIDNPLDPLGTLRVVDDSEERMKLASDLDTDFTRSHEGENLAKRKNQQERIQKLKDSNFSKALDLGKETEEMKSAYGRTNFGFACLLARRLVEHGVKFVEVSMGGWDTHADNFRAVKGLLNTLDTPFAMLLKDLADRKLLDSTLVLWMGEFGRTPTINQANGRDHWGKAFSVVMAGGGVGGGRVYGETDADGAEVKKDPVTVPDIMATVCALHGIDPGKKYFTHQTGVVRVTENGKPIKALFD